MGYVVNFSNDIAPDERAEITSWIEENLPNEPTHIRLKMGEYVLTNVNDSNGVAKSYSVTKPKKIIKPTY